MHSNRSIPSQFRVYTAVPGDLLAMGKNTQRSVSYGKNYSEGYLLRWVRSRNVYRPRTGGDRRDRWRMLMKRLLLYTTTGCGGSERLAATNPPSYRIIILPNTNPNCSVTSVLFERRALLYRNHARDAVYACSRI